MRPIDADALMKTVFNDVVLVDGEVKGVGLILAETVDKAPTIDAVPVVRRRECKHHRDKNEQEQQYLVEDVLICTSPDATDDCWNAVWPDHFCSYGERKGE